MGVKRGDRAPVVGVTAVPRTVPTGYGPDRADTATEAMVRGVLGAGAVPVVLPVVPPEVADRQLAALDALILAGGQDLALPVDGQDDGERWIDPARDEHEFAIWEAARKRGTPVLGLCRGLQLVNVALGGTLRQHVESHDAGSGHGAAFHPIDVREGTRLAAIVGDRRRVEVNTIHHQAIADPAEGMRVSGRADDGTIEAAELDGDGPWFVGVQWHPELMLDSPAGQPLFDALVAGLLQGRAS